MNHEASLIATVAAGFGLAMLLGFIAARLKMPPLVGYLFAGIAIGPHTRGFVGDVAVAGQLAEIGVMLLMFGVGLHFSIEHLMELRGLAVPGALVQMTVAAAAGCGLAMLWGWKLGPALVFGLCLCVSSTVVLLRTLEARHLQSSFSGRVAIGWLVVQDLVMVLVLVLLPALSGALGGQVPAGGSGRGLAAVVAITLAKVAAFIAVMFLAGRRLLPKLLWLVAKTGSRELFTLGVVAAAIGVAYGSSHLFGVSFALGAFFAGMMMRESALSHRAAEESLPLQDAFAVLFFVSVGMLFDPMIVVREPLAVISVAALIMIVSPLASMSFVVARRYPLKTALTVGAGLAQIGEFSFILAGLGASLGLMSNDGRSLVLAGALVSIALNPLVFGAAAPALRWAEARSDLARRLERNPDPLAGLPMTVDASYLTGHVVIVGYGRVGHRIADALLEKRVPFVVIEQNREAVERLRRMNLAAVSGDATEASTLIQGHVARARMLVVATPDTVNVREIARIARMLNPKIEIVLRTHSDEEAGLLRSENAGEVFMGEHELARAMTRHVLGRMESRGAQNG